MERKITYGEIGPRFGLAPTQRIREIFDILKGLTIGCGVNLIFWLFVELNTSSEKIRDVNRGYVMVSIQEILRILHEILLRSQ